MLARRLKNVSLCFALAALSLPVDAQTKAHPLWKVESPSNTIYLLGSIHLLKASDYPLPAVIETAFSNAQVVAFETDISPADTASAQAKLLTKGGLPEGETIKDELSPSTYAALGTYMVHAGLPMELVENVKPVMAGMILDVIELQKLGLDPARGLDQHFYEQAQQSGKTIIPLEPLDFQIDLLTGFSKSEGELFLKDTITEMDDTEKNFDQVVAAWKTGDSVKLEKFLNDALADAPVIYKRLLTDRNQQWLPKIEGFVASGKPTIVIVGAGHLVGKGGIVNLLKGHGLKVTQL